jgi:small subunit ribosomal protein S25e
MGSKNKSVSSSEKSQSGKDKAKKDKKEHSEKKEVSVFINEDEAGKIIKSSKVITIQDLARQTNVKISTANAFLIKELKQGTVKKVGGFSGHFIYQPVSQ